jgi:hypothetical protein
MCLIQARRRDEFRMQPANGRVVKRSGVVLSSERPPPQRTGQRSTASGRHVPTDSGEVHIAALAIFSSITNQARFRGHQPKK